MLLISRVRRTIREYQFALTMVAGFLMLWLLTAAVFLTTEGPSETVLFLVSFFVVPALAELYKFIVKNFEWKPGKIHISIVLTGVAILITYFMGDGFFETLPPIQDDFAIWLGSLVQGLGNLVGAAMILYNLIYDWFLDAIANKAPRGLLSYRVKKIN